MEGDGTLITTTFICLYNNKSADTNTRSCEASYHMNLIAICKATKSKRFLIRSKVNNSVVCFSRISILDLDLRDKKSYPKTVCADGRCCTDRFT
jgi:hypothetical protein